MGTRSLFGFLLAFLLMETDPTFATNEEPVGEDRIPLLIIGGLRDTQKTFGNLILALEAEGESVHFFPIDLNSNKTSQERLEELDSEITRIRKSENAKKLQILAHSMGFLLVEAYLIQHPDAATFIHHFTTSNPFFHLSEALDLNDFRKIFDKSATSEKITLRFRFRSARRVHVISNRVPAKSMLPFSEMFELVMENASRFSEGAAGQRAKVPTTVVLSADDPNFSPAVYYWVHQMQKAGMPVNMIGASTDNPDRHNLWRGLSMDLIDIAKGRYEKGRAFSDNVIANISANHAASCYFATLNFMRTQHLPVKKQDDIIDLSK